MAENNLQGEEEILEERNEETFDYDILSQEEREEISEAILNNCNSGYLKGNRQWFVSVTKIKV